MAKETYSEKLQHPKWQKKRLQILNRDKFTCKKCGDRETTLHVHHIEYWPKTEPWDYPNYIYITLCKHCHSEVEELKDEVDISEIDILKITNWTSGGRLVMVSTPVEIRFLFYDKDDGVEVNIGFNESISTEIKKFITKSLKRHGKKNDGLGQVEQALSKEHESPL